jgi:hypothetical protein
MKLLAMALAASLALSACATTSGPPVEVVPNNVPVPSGATPISAAAQKALYAAEAAYNVPAQAYVTLNRAGKLSPELKARAKPVLQQAIAGLKLARQAAAAGDTVGTMLQINEVNRLAAQAAAILPKS